MKDNRASYRRYWWQYAEKRVELYIAIANKSRVLVTPQTSNVQALAFLPPHMVLGHTLIVFPMETYSAFAILQSRVHQVWSAFLGTPIKDDRRYAHSDCFETFPFPHAWEAHPTFETTGETYYEYRANLITRKDEGLTKTYNRFHDPYEDRIEIVELRDLQAAMDRAVLDAYGWTDVPTACGFLLDYEITEGDWGRKRKPFRYRWPDAVRNEVLVRLLALNAERAAEETHLGMKLNPSVEQSLRQRSGSRSR